MQTLRGFVSYITDEIRYFAQRLLVRKKKKGKRAYRIETRTAHNATPTHRTA